MRKAFLLSLIIVFAATSSAQAQVWTRARGVLIMAYFEDNLGHSISDIDPANRSIPINANLRRKSNERGIQTSCTTNAALKQRVCNSTYYYELPGNGSCLYTTKMILNNFTSTSRKIQAFFEALAQCPSGYAAYAQYSGRITRS